MHLIFVALVVLLHLFSSAEAWGPLSHYYFARSAFGGSGYLDASLKQSCDVPDGIYFSNFAQYPSCNIPVADFHYGVTAGHIVKFALSEAGGKFKTATFDPLAFGLGYGSHMIADLVGFYAGGYLGSTVQSYVTFFPFMTAIDSFVSFRDVFPPNTPWTSQETITFFSAATQYLNNVTKGKILVYNITEVENCLLPWAETDDGLIELALLQASSGYVQKALVQFDRYNATSYEEAATNFENSYKCVISAIQFWGQAIIQNEVTPDSVYSQTVSFIASQYQQGKCVPQ